MAIRKRVIKDYIEPGHDQLSLRTEPKIKKRKRIRYPLEIKAGESFRRQTGEWVYREMRVDHKSDRYREIVIDPKTRKVIHRREEPLPKHTGHGSARKKSKR